MKTFTGCQIKVEKEGRLKEAAESHGKQRVRAAPWAYKWKGRYWYPANCRHCMCCTAWRPAVERYCAMLPRVADLSLLGHGRRDRLSLVNYEKDLHFSRVTSTCVGRPGGKLTATVLVCFSRQRRRPPASRLETPRSSCQVLCPQGAQRPLREKPLPIALALACSPDGRCIVELGVFTVI